MKYMTFLILGFSLVLIVLNIIFGVFYFKYVIPSAKMALEKYLDVKIGTTISSTWTTAKDSPNNTLVNNLILILAQFSLMIGFVGVILLQLSIYYFIPLMFSSR